MINVLHVLITTYFAECWFSKIDVEIRQNALPLGIFWGVYL